MPYLHRTTIVLIGFLLLGSAVRAADGPGEATSETLPNPIAPAAERIFGIVPNYNTVDASERVTPLTTRHSFHVATLSSFDPFVYPLIGFMAAVNGGSSRATYRATYGRMVADNAIGNYLTMAALPSLVHEDPRYFALGRGGAWQRAVYALSRSVVTRTTSGRLTFNISELAGNGAAAALSNVYYDPAQRTLSGTMNRWTSQVLSDTLGNELKEFWPDIRRALHGF